MKRLKRKSLLATVGVLAAVSIVVLLMSRRPQEPYYLGDKTPSPQRGIKGIASRQSPFRNSGANDRESPNQQQGLDKKIAQLDSGIIPDSIPAQVRIQRLVHDIENETLSQSIANLDNVGAFYWPGAHDEMSLTKFPLPREIGSRELHLIQSNRRFLRCFADLSKLSESEASQIVSAEIDAALPLYLKLFDECLEETIQQRKLIPITSATQGYVSGPSFRISDDPNDPSAPSVAGLRLKLLALLMIAGNLELKGARRCVEKAADVARAQKDRFYSNDPWLTETDRFLYLRNLSIYHRQILAIALAGSAPQDLATAIRENGHQLIGASLPAFEANATPYDLFTRNEGPIPVDFSKGKIEILYPEPMTDAEFEKYSP